MLKKFCVVAVVLGSIVSAICIACLSGCYEAASGPHLQVDPPKLVQGTVSETICVDGWEALRVGGTLMYRHEHDVQEHLISCQGGQ